MVEGIHPSDPIPAKKELFHFKKNKKLDKTYDYTAFEVYLGPKTKKFNTENLFARKCKADIGTKVYCLCD